MKKRILIGVIAFLILVPLVTLCIVKMGESNYKNALRRTENDFTTENFVINQIWELKNVKTRGLTGEDVLKSYIFIKPANEDFNLRFSDSDFSNTSENRDRILSQINEGDKISAKVLKSQIEDARKSGVFAQIKRFVQGDKREVAIYKIIDNDVTVSETDINSYDVVDADFLDRFNRMAAILGLFALGIFIYAARKIRERRATQNLAGTANGF